MNLSQFKNNLSHINDIIYFDKHEYLREKTSNPSKLRRLIVDGESRL